MGRPATRRALKSLSLSGTARGCGWLTDVLASLVDPPLEEPKQPALEIHGSSERRFAAPATVFKGQPMPPGVAAFAEGFASHALALCSARRIDSFRRRARGV